MTTRENGDLWLCQCKHDGEVEKRGIDAPEVATVPKTPVDEGRDIVDTIRSICAGAATIRGAGGGKTRLQRSGDGPGEFRVLRGRPVQPRALVPTPSIGISILFAELQSARLLYNIWRGTGTTSRHSPNINQRWTLCRVQSNLLRVPHDVPHISPKPTLDLIAQKVI
jgi:hypothetical protein